MEQSNSSVPNASPRRRPRWWRRFGFTVLGLVLATVAAHWVWGYRAQACVDANLAALKAAGEPTTRAELEGAPAPEGENAANDLLAAGKLLLAREHDGKAFAALEPELPLTDAEVATIGAEVEATKEVIKLIEAASVKPRAYWRLDPSLPILMQDLPGLNTARGLAELLYADALLSHQRGRDDLVLRRIEQMHAIARAVDQQSTLISHLVATGIRAMAFRTVEQVAPDMKVGSDPGAVSVANIRAEIKRLLDDSASRAGFARAMRAERIEHVRITSAVLAGLSTVPLTGQGGRKSSSQGPLVRYLMKPAFLESEDLLLRATTAALQEFEASKAWRSFADNPGNQWERVREEVMASPRRYLLAAILMPSYDNMVKNEFRVATDGRLAAIALAARLYATDHGGALPQSLEHLVPAYLPVVPNDSMAAGTPLRLVGAPGEPRVYSVGDDGVDGGGDGTRIKPSSDPEPPARWQCHDAVMYLKRQPRYIRPVEPPVDDWEQRIRESHGKR